MTTLILFILILGATVLVHEFGHFIFAKIVGIHVYEFSIGMGPAIFKTKPKSEKDTLYAIRAIPIGGYVSLAGEEVEIDKNKFKGQKLQDKKAWQRFLVMFFGAGNNFIFAFLITLVMACFLGTTSYKPIINTEGEQNPVYLAGIRSGDIITKIDDNKVTYFDDARIYLSLHCSEAIKSYEENHTTPSLSISIKRPSANMQEYTFTLSPNVVISEEGSSCVYGLSQNTNEKPGILPYAYHTWAKYFKQMGMTFKLLFTGGASVSDLSGPVGIFSAVGAAKESGLKTVLELIVLLNINVGVINLIPLPAFDGGRILFLIIEKIKGSPVSPKIENIIHSIGFILLIGLMIFVTINDILRLF